MEHERNKPEMSVTGSSGNESTDASSIHFPPHLEGDFLCFSPEFAVAQLNVVFLRGAEVKGQVRGQ